MPRCEGFDLKTRRGPITNRSPARRVSPAARADRNSRKFELDFRVGGTEISSGIGPDGSVYTYEALYQDIVPDQRFVYSYDMRMDGTRISVSLATVEFKPSGGGTRLIFIEQGAFLDGHDIPAQRAQGTGGLLDALGEELQRVPTSTEEAAS